MPPRFEYTVDGEPQATTEHQLTAAQILANAGIDGATHYLVQLEGDKRISYQGRPSEPVHMHEHMRFISISMAPTPVS
jgi:hypothetical protein